MTFGSLQGWYVTNLFIKFTVHNLIEKEIKIGK